MARAQVTFVSGDLKVYGLSDRLEEALTEISKMSQRAQADFINIATCLTIKAAMPDVDIRYHPKQIQKDTDRPAGFNFRGVSEKVVYPWLNENTFEGAKSGWQTRTLERPKPYMLSYDENIGTIKGAFLATFDEIEEKGQSAEDALAYILHLQLVLRESKKITMSYPRTTDIQLIVKLFKEHFFMNIKRLVELRDFPYWYCTPSILFSSNNSIGIGGGVKIIIGTFYSRLADWCCGRYQNHQFRNRSGFRGN
jgi:DNA (cytosine-5)-methyltransferase 1